MHELKLSEYARRKGISYRTALRWFHAGNIPGRRMPSGTILVQDDAEADGQPTVRRAALYARVSSSENKGNLSTQLERIRQFSVASGMQVTHAISEVGSGLNDSRPKLLKLVFETDDWDVLVVEHKDRLTRFGFRYLQGAVEAAGKEILVVNPTEANTEADLMNDFTSLVTSFCARLYGLRRSKRATEKLIKAAGDAA